MPTRHAEFSGEVVRRAVDAGSKSERETVVLALADGQYFVLRKADGPSFGSSGFEDLVGTSIRASGTAVGRTLIVRDWQQLPD